MFTKSRNRLAVERADKLVFIAANKGRMQGREDQEVFMQLLGASDDD